MHPEHKNILSEIKKHRGKGTRHSNNNSYILSGHTYYDVSVPIRRMIAKAWVKAHTGVSTDELIDVLNSLYKGESHEEKTVASYILDYSPVLRATINPDHINNWLDELVGWAEVDALCQSVFTASEILDRWQLWKKVLRQLCSDSNINKRRASLVLLTGPVRTRDDVRLRDEALKSIDQLKSEEDILITKAISWLLREMVKNHKQAVKKYLKENRNTLPKVAVRETERKIKTGRK